MINASLLFALLCGLMLSAGAQHGMVYDNLSLPSNILDADD